MTAGRQEHDRPTRRTRRGDGLRARRVAWLAVGVAMSAFAVYEVVVHDLWPAILACWLLPDLTFLMGAGQGHEPGQLPPRAVPAYNLAHRPLLPLALIALALVALLAARLLNQDQVGFEAARRVPLYLYTAAIGWFAHIAVDRGFGFGLRTAAGWQRNEVRSRRDVTGDAVNPRR